MKRNAGCPRMPIREKSCLSSVLLSRLLAITMTGTQAAMMDHDALWQISKNSKVLRLCAVAINLHLHKK